MKISFLNSILGEIKSLDEVLGAATRSCRAHPDSVTRICRPQGANFHLCAPAPALDGCCLSHWKACGGAQCQQDWDDLAEHSRTLLILAVLHGFNSWHGQAQVMWGYYTILGSANSDLH